MYRSLKGRKIVETLGYRVHERVPDSGLRDVVREGDPVEAGGSARES